MLDDVVAFMGSKKFLFCHKITVLFFCDLICVLRNQTLYRTFYHIYCKNIWKIYGHYAKLTYDT